MTQRDRVLRRLRQGELSPVDFAAPACDGLAPIMRVAARVQDLRDQGHKITTSRAANGTAIYRLVELGAKDGAPVVTAPPADDHAADRTTSTGTVSGALFSADAFRPQHAHYSQEAAA